MMENVLMKVKNQQHYMNQKEQYIVIQSLSNKYDNTAK